MPSMPDDGPGVSLGALEEGVALLRFERPRQLNALTDDTVAEIARLLDRVGADQKTRVLVVTGSGRGFCAGFDLGLAGDAPGSAELGETPAWMQRQESFASLVTRMRALRQPVIAAVNGPANGAGLGIALAAEIRIAARSAAFNSAFVRVGMSSCDIGVSWLLPRCVGMSRAFEIMLTGRMVDAAEAERIGLVNQVVPSGKLIQSAIEIGRMIAKNDARMVQGIKRLLHEGMGLDWQGRYDLEDEARATYLAAGHPRDGFKDFLARKPVRG